MLEGHITEISPLKIYMRALVKSHYFLLLGVDCRTPSESAPLPPSSLEPTDVTDYREELALSLSSARTLAASQIQKAQSKYKKCYYRKAKL